MKGHNEAIDFLNETNKMYSVGESTDLIGQIVERNLLGMKEKEVCKIHLDTENLPHFVELYKLPLDVESVELVIELKSFERAKDFWHLAVSERQTIAAGYRELGNGLFSHQLYSQAALHYASAIKYLIPISQSDLNVDILKLKNICYLNLSVCQLHTRDYQHVVVNCDRVLATEDNNIKALFRKGKALLELNDFEAAKLHLLRTRSLDPTLKAVSDLLKEVEIRNKKYNVKLSKALKSGFS